ncbi:hypothetical protein MA16_Dca003004 [Dendrobium catenatum]|uniref:Uncharacterized protein n=1 Tax=Dendrobium catenatum TaxID=906689 RepID=A0A2I0X9B3_9ASPA|nr:hypothetical protein MA16_Dca003004 [Dendrobium catenatum]
MDRCSETSESPASGRNLVMGRNPTLFGGQEAVEEESGSKRTLHSLLAWASFLLSSSPFMRNEGSVF